MRTYKQIQRIVVAYGLFKLHFIIHTQFFSKSPKPVFYLWLSKVSANEGRRYLCNVFFHWLRPCSAMDRNGVWGVCVCVCVCVGGGGGGGGRLNITMSPYQYGDSHYKDETASRPCYFYIENPIAGKTVSFILWWGSGVLTQIFL